MKPSPAAGRRRPVAILLAAAALLVSGCVTTLGDPMPSEGTFVERAYTPRALDFEKLLPLHQQEATLLHAVSNGFAEVPGLERYVNEVLQRILLASPQPDYPARAYLLASQSPIAQVTPNGAIFLSIGLLETLKSEDELAFVLAHELSHALLGHHDSDWMVTAQGRVVAMGEQMIGMMEAMRQRIGEGPQLDWRVAVIGYGAQIATRDLIAPAFNRRQEDEADLMGLDLMVLAGYSTLGATDVMEVFVAAEQGGTDSEVARTRLERAVGLSAYEEREAVPANGAEAVTRQPVETFMNALVSGVDEMLTLVRRTHRPAGERVDRLNDYGGQAYLAHAPDMTTAPLLAALRAGGTAQVLARYRDAHAATEALAQERLGEAEALARRAVAAPTANHAYPRLAFARIRAAQGRQNLWEQNLRIALQGSSPPLMIHQELAGRLLRSGRHGDAAAVLEQGWLRYDEPGFLLPLMIAAAVAQGNGTRSDELLLRCRFAHPELTEPCERARAGELLS